MYQVGIDFFNAIPSTVIMDIPFSATKTAKIFLRQIGAIVFQKQMDGAYSFRLTMKFNLNCRL